MNLQHTIKKGKLGNEVYVKDSKVGGYTGFFQDFPQIVSEGETIKQVQTKLWNVVYDTLKHFLKKDETNVAV